MPHFVCARSHARSARGVLNTMGRFYCLTAQVGILPLVCIDNTIGLMGWTAFFRICLR